MLKSCELSPKLLASKAAVRSTCANRASVGRRLFVGVWASGVARFRGYAVRLVGAAFRAIVRGFAACKAKLYAIVSHGECYTGTTKGGQGASVAFEEVRSSCLSCFPGIKPLSRACRLTAGQLAGLAVRPVPWMLHFVTIRHQKRYSCCSGCSMWGNIRPLSND